MTNKNNLQAPTDNEIAVYAYHLWEADGCVSGRDMDYWLQAKAHLTADRKYEADLFKNGESSQKTRANSPMENVATAQPQIVATSKGPKKRQARMARETVYA